MAASSTRVVVAFLRDGDEVAVRTLTAPGRPDVCLVDELARLLLAARRSRCSVELRCGEGDLANLVDLLDLLDLFGLTDVLAGRGRLRVEVLGQAEGGEEGGVEEVVVPDDPVA